MSVADIGQRDLFADDGHRQCFECGTTFAIVPTRGRPVVFCSDSCRLARIRKQKAAWRRTQAAESASCWNCSTPLVAHSGPGRLGRYCSKECRRTGIAMRRIERHQRRFVRAPLTTQTNGASDGNASG